MVDQTKTLNQTERKVKNYLNKAGYSSPVIIQLKLGLSKYQVQQTLDSLWKRSIVARPIKGLAISLTWIENNPEEKTRIEEAIKSEVR